MDQIKAAITEEAKRVLSEPIGEHTLRKLKFLQIVLDLISSGRRLAKRSVYYQSVPIFGSQAVTDGLIKHYTAKFNCQQEDLNIRSGLKGVFRGVLVFRTKEGLTIRQDSGIIPDMNDIASVEHGYKAVLVVEKETIFNRITDCPDMLIVCGKGYPCANTTRLLRMAGECKMYCLTDFDPYGLHIFLTYSKSIGGMKRIGLGAGDLFRYKVDRNDCIPLSLYDRRMIKLVKGTPMCEEAMFIEGLGYKMELEVVFNQGGFSMAEYLHEHLS